MWGCPELHGVRLQGGGGFGVGCLSALVQAGTIHPWLAGGQTQGEQETVGKEVVSGMFIKIKSQLPLLSLVQTGPVSTTKFKIKKLS